MAGRKMSFLKHLGEWGSLVEIVALLHKKSTSVLQKQTCQKAFSVTSGSPALPETRAESSCQIAK